MNLIFLKYFAICRPGPPPEVSLDVPRRSSTLLGRRPSTCLDAPRRPSTLPDPPWSPRGPPRMQIMYVRSESVRFCLMRFVLFISGRFCAFSVRFGPFGRRSARFCKIMLLLCVSTCVSARFCPILLFLFALCQIRPDSVRLGPFSTELLGFMMGWATGGRVDGWGLGRPVDISLREHRATRAAQWRHILARHCECSTITILRSNDR